MSVTVQTPPFRTNLLELENLWPEQGQWTYEDYKQLPDDRWIYEIIEGELYMSPAPKPRHQKSVLKLGSKLDLFCEEHSVGEIYVAPIDVKLPGFADPVQPDVVFVLHNRLSIVKEDYIEGAPDFLAEVLSPSNWIVDRQKKFEIYAKAGVKEYWIIDPKMRTIEQFVLRDSNYELLGKFEEGEAVRSEVVQGFSIEVNEICTF
ncbi:MAG: Uma2 family endonuclease [bacterium]